MIDKHPCLRIDSSLGVFFLPLKAIEFNGVDITGFLKNFADLLCLFILVDFQKPYC